MGEAKDDVDVLDLATWCYPNVWQLVSLMGVYEECIYIYGQKARIDDDKS